MGDCCSKKKKMDKYIISSKKSKDFKLKFEYISTLGNGSFGKVKLYRDRFLNEIKFAIKTMKKSEMNLNQINSFKNEIDILRKLDHPNIVKYFDTYEDEGTIHLVMEYIQGENLMQLIKQRKLNNFNENNGCQIIKCLLKAVLFLHNNNIIHRDIKPENILFSTTGKFFPLN